MRQGEQYRMPTAPQRPCATPGCPALVSSGHCATHARRRADARGTTVERGYDSKCWKKLRIIKLRANPLCEIQTHCLGLAPDAAATAVDHIFTIRERPDLRLAWENLRSACRACHSARSAAQSRGGDTAPPSPEFRARLARMQEMKPSPELTPAWP